MLMEPHMTTGVFGVEVEMQLFTLSITDLTTFESVAHEEWAEKEDLFEIGNRFARAMLAANPNFRHRGNERCWHICDMRTNPANVCSLG